METQIGDPLSRLIASNPLRPGNEIEIEVGGPHLELYRRPRKPVGVPAPVEGLSAPRTEAAS